MPEHCGAHDQHSDQHQCCGSCDDRHDTHPALALVTDSTTPAPDLPDHTA